MLPTSDFEYVGVKKHFGILVGYGDMLSALKSFHPRIDVEIVPGIHRLVFVIIHVFVIIEIHSFIHI